MKHKHADLIHAWADGAVIQFKVFANDEWHDCAGQPDWFENGEYRIKPEEKKPVVRWLWAVRSAAGFYPVELFMTELEAQSYFGGQQQIKLEWSRTEFPE